MDVHFHERMREKGGVRKSDRRFITFTTVNGDIWKAKVFIDATYEGDLMAAAGVSFAWEGEASRNMQKAWLAYA
ncbi:MAG: FAD-dependent oxidoreductase [Acidobacteriaceae bacterium]